MAIPGFEYQEFAKNLSQQAYELIPPDFTKDQKDYVANTLLNFSTISGQALNEDTELNFNIDQAMLITQIIAEWSFHKSVDLIRSGIPQMYWDKVMQKIAFTIFEVAKNGFKKNIPQDQILELIEHHVKKAYVESIDELKQGNKIDEKLAERAATQSNIDAMIQEQAVAEQQQQQEAAAPTPQEHPNQQPQPRGANKVAPVPAGVNPKLLRLSTLALLFQKMKQEKVQVMLDKFDTEDATTVIKFMGMSDLTEKVDPYLAMQCLQEIKMNLPKPTVDLNPTKIVQRIQNMSKCVDKNKLDKFLILERDRVKRFVFTALEGEYLEMPPKIANIIATHVQNSV